jgi:hypothetical protein
VFQQLFFASDPAQDTEQLFVLQTDGTLLRFANVDLQGLASALAAGSKARAIQVKKSIRMEQIPLADVHGEQVGAVAVRFAPDGRACVVVGGKGRFSLSVWHDRKNAEEDGDMSPVLQMIDAVGSTVRRNIVQVQLTDDLRRVVTLDEDGNVGIWDRRR